MLKEAVSSRFCLGCEQHDDDIQNGNGALDVCASIDVENRLSLSWRPFS
jgi:hypothetical protein